MKQRLFLNRYGVPHNDLFLYLLYSLCMLMRSMRLLDQYQGFKKGGDAKRFIQQILWGKIRNSENFHIKNLISKHSSTYY